MSISSYIMLLLSIVSLSACDLNSPAVYSRFSPQAVVQTDIIGGESAQPQEFPFLVNIWLNTPKDQYVAHLCGGSLIASRWVLTAAHCVLQDVSDKSQGVLKLTDLQLFLGSNQISGQGGRRVAPQAIFVHPEFSWPYYDVALIQLTEPVLDIQPIQLNQVDLESSPADLSQPLTVAGWGVTDQAGLKEPEILQKATISLISRQLCQKDRFVLKEGWTIGRDMLCAQTKSNQIASCHGDSGGPLFKRQEHRFVQVGIVSWGSACRGQSSLNGSSVEGYADVSGASAWITKTVTK